MPDPAAPTEPVEETPPAGAPDPAPAEPTDPPAEPEMFDKSYVEKLRKEAASHRKERNEAQAALKAREAADMTEAEKVAARAQAAETELQTLRRERAALQAGFPGDAAEFLTGDTPEELAESAERLKALLPTPAAPTADPAPPTTWPANAPQGPRGPSKAPSLVQQIADAEAAGNYDQATRLRMAQVAQQTPVGT